MKQFHKTSYSKNKGSEDIVYRSVTGDYSISQEAFLDSDPALRAEDYAFFKRWSDENYRAEDSRDAKEARRVPPLEHISSLSAPAGEEGICADGSNYMRSLENAQRILNAAALTPVQKRRFLMYHYKGLTLREIAVYEDVGYSKIVKSIVQAEKKIYKILQQMPK